MGASSRVRGQEEKNYPILTSLNKLQNVHGITSQKATIFIVIPVRSSHFTLLLLFVGGTLVSERKDVIIK
jgi:hypothetical protein